MNTSPEYLMLINAIYPIGHIYKSTLNINPQTFIPGTTWTNLGLQDLFLYNSKDEITESNRTGGSAVAELTELPVHTHTGTLYNRNHYGQNNSRNFYRASATPNGTSATPPDIATTSYGSSASSPTHNNMPPYRAVYMWRRDS